MLSVEYLKSYLKMGFPLGVVREQRVRWKLNRELALSAKRGPWTPRNQRLEAAILDVR